MLHEEKPPISANHRAEASAENERGSSVRVDGAAPSFSIRLFGPFEVATRGQPLPHIRFRKSQALLALLALRQGSEIERDWLLGLLWPEERSTQALRNALTHLRQALGPEVARLTSPTARTLALDLTGAFVDVLAFDAALARGDPEALEEAVFLYRGPLLEGNTEEWVFQERQVHEQAYLTAREQLAELALTRDEAAAAVGHLRAAVAADPLRESAQRALMKALAAGGNYAAAMLAYRELRQRLHRELNAEPDPDTQALMQRLRHEARNRARAITASPATERPNGRRIEPRPTIPRDQEPGEHRLKDLARPERIYPLVRPELPSHFRPLKSLRARPHNPPAQTTALIGREREVATVCERLRHDEIRLVTLTGPGGVGKTRLGLQVAAVMADGFADGIFLVDLAPLRDPSLVAASIGQILGLRETGGQSFMESLKGHLHGRQLLLVLDNFEHLLPAAAVVADLLAVSPGLKVLVTSRAPLRLWGESEYPVPPLPAPAPPHAGLSDQAPGARQSGPEGLDPTHWAQFDAVQLFVQRAQDVRSDFAVTPTNAVKIAEICCRLDGLPLAIELAAARLRALSVEQIAARLDDRFRLLTGGSRAALPRQQTLKGLIDWSYDLLPHSERALLRRLSIFAGGWTLEAAEAVCSDDGLPANSEKPAPPTPLMPGPIPDLQLQVQKVDVLDLLNHLVEHSLVIHEERDGVSRYRLLETIREYAHERAEGEPDVLRVVVDRHAQFYLGFAEQYVARMRTRDQTRALEAMEPELDNLRIAMDEARARRQHELCARLALSFTIRCTGKDGGRMRSGAYR
jgi:predicted ATPase/DNA-binding SARP family transcriptional activator